MLLFFILVNRKYKLAICMKRRPLPCGDEDRVRNSKPSSVRGLRSSETSLKTEDESSASVSRLGCGHSVLRVSPGNVTTVCVNKALAKISAAGKLFSPSLAPRGGGGDVHRI